MSGPGERPETGRIVLLLDSAYPDHGLEREIIEEAGGTLVACEAPVWDEQAVLGQALLPEAEVILVGLAPVTARVLGHARSCRLVVRYGVGVDNVDVAAASAAGIWVANVPSYATDSAADHTVLLLLAIARSLRAAIEGIGTGQWREAIHGCTPLGLRGRVLGIVGYGHIGTAVGSRAQAMGLEVWAYDPHVGAEIMARNGVVRSELELLLRRSDVVSLHCPLTELTYHMIRKETLEMMKPGAILINTARGGVVDLDDLVGALEPGHLLGAGLDVFDDEPLPAGHPLRTHPAVIATPHVAYLSDSSVRELRTSVANNAAVVLQGGRPLSPVNEPDVPRARRHPAPTGRTNAH